MMDLSIPFAVQNEDGQKKTNPMYSRAAPRNKNTNKQSIHIPYQKQGTKRRHRCVTDK